MTYLLSQIFISLLLAGLAGGAFGWILHGFKANQRERELKNTLGRHSTALAQAQQERQMIADDYDEMKLGFESRISELQYENRKLPDLEENLEKSQQLVIQMIKKHEAETSELAALNNGLHSELESLKIGKENTDAVATAPVPAKPHGKANTKPAGSASPSKASPAKQSASSSNQMAEKQRNTQVSATNTHEQLSIASVDNHNEHKTDVNLKNATSAASAQAAVSTSAAASESLDLSRENTLSDSGGQWEDEAAEQQELLALETEIEEMRAMDGQLAGGDNLTLDHERELEMDSLDESSTIDLAREIEQEIATPVVAENTQGESNKKSVTTQNSVATQNSVQTKNTSAAAPSVAASVHAKNDTERNATEDSDLLRSSLREKFSGQSDDDVDDLQIIHGIGPVIERSLNDIGITNFNQLATLTRHEIEEVAEILKIFPGRIERDNWIGNARRLVSTETKDSYSAETGSSHSKPDAEELENA